MEKFLALIKKYLEGAASSKEKEQVDDWYESADNKSLTQPVDRKSLTRTKEESYKNILQEIRLNKPAIPMYRRNGFRVAAAAVLLLIGSGVYFLMQRGDTKENSIGPTNTVALKQDVLAPQDNKAVLTLSNGTKIILDSSGNGTLVMQGNVSVTKKENGVIEYDGKTDETAYNTLYVPKGSKPMKLALADGSMVWLNVASSITYPVAFNGRERKVEINGEAYFEIAKNDKMPFVLKKMNDDVEVRVLGTHFNVNAYNDEPHVKVTLLEGSVNVSKGGTKSLLKPGEQAVVTGYSSIAIKSDADIDEVMAWKNGRFYFDGAEIKTIMRQIEKWYDVDIQYDSEVKYSFVAKISRDVNVSQILKIFEMTDLVHFKIEGKKIIVMK